MPELPTPFGKYYLTEKLATGGMAEIYLAKLIGPGGFEKQLVLKQIHPMLSGQRHFVDLFVAEAKTLVSLAHGNIVPVYELGVIDDTYFIAMDYIDGPTLYRLTESMAGRGAQMEPAVAAWIAARILEGLDYAHRKGEGVIHRDLSPRNVMLSRDGEVKLVDFGIAVTLGEPGEPSATQSAPTGSFPYMSPEQVRREALTAQTDLFSVGVLCWEMLAGERLFARNDPEATLEAVQHEAIPPPSTKRAEIAAKLDEVVIRALERDRTARWPSAADMLAALNKYLYTLDDTPGPREVAALVARYCPPETRRLPTHVEAEASDDGPPGPRTAEIPRDGSAPHGKRQRRHQTFATNVALEGMLEQASAAGPETKVTPRPAPAESAAGPDAEAGAPAEVTAPLAVAASTRVRSQPRMRAVEEPIQPHLHSEVATAEHVSSPAIESASTRRGVIAPRLELPGREAPRRSTLVLAALGTLALAVGAIYMFYRGRAGVLQSDGSIPPADARSVAIVADASAADSAMPEDAPSPPSDASALARPRQDAAVAHLTADAALAAATATLMLGADPWGEIYIDGKPYGHTPKQIPVPAGHHDVEIVFPAETPPRKQTFAVDLTAGETKSLSADFK
jgi:serine/threonine-protein kinase